MDKKVVFTPEMAWTQQNYFPEDIGVKVLREDDACGARTLLVRIPPEGEIPAHSHRGVVQRYVLEGRCEIGEGDFAAGSFSLLPEHCDVGPMKSRDGATVLLVYDPIVS